MDNIIFPTLDMKATGQNIARLRKAKGLTVKELQEYFGFEQPQAIYKWQWGKSLPSVDNLLALSYIFGTTIDNILIADSSQDVCFLEYIFNIKDNLKFYEARYSLFKLLN